MNQTEDQLRGLLGEAWEMPYGAGQIALVEQIIAQADAQRLTELAFEVRMLGTTAYVYGGEPAKSFVTFSWCLSEFDRDPGRYGGAYRSLLWHFKYMVLGLRRFPEVPLDRVQAVVDEMERRYRDAGYGPHAVYAARHQLAEHLGDLDAAQHWFDKWCATPRDDLSDCVGCDPTGKASWLVTTGRDEEAVALAEPVLAGRLTCTEQPQEMLTRLLLPYLRTGRLEQARDAHRQAYLRYRPHLADLPGIAEHVFFCAITGNHARALEIVQRHLAWLDRAPSPYAAMRFAASASLALSRAGSAGDPNATIHRPAHRDRPAASPRIVDLAAELAADARALAARFDARNGTGRQGELIEAVLSAGQLVEYLPLTATRRSVSTGSAAAPPAPGTGEPAENPAEPAEAPSGERGRPTADPAPAGPRPVPETAGPDELLDLASRWYREDDQQAAFAAWRAFDERYGHGKLTVVQRARLLDGRGLESAHRRDYPSAAEHWREAERGYAEAGDEVRRQRALGRIGQVYCETGDVDTGLPMVQSSTAYLQAHGSPDQQVSALYRLAAALAGSGRYDESLATLDQVAERIGQPEPAPEAKVDERVRLAVARAGALAESGANERALATAQEARELCRPDDRRNRARASWVVANAAMRIGDNERAVEAFEEVMEVAEGDLRWAAVLSRTRLLAGTPRAAEVVDDLVEAVARFTAAGEDGDAAYARYLLTMAYLNSGRPLDAAEAGEEAVAGLSGPAAMDARHALAAAYQRLDMPGQAIACLEVIQADCATRGNHAGHGAISEQIADLLDRQDQDAAAARQFGAAAEAYRAAGLPLDEVRARRRQSTSLLWSGDPEAATARSAEVDRLAAELPDGHGIAWERAVIDYDAARVCNGAGRIDEAVARAERSIAGFDDLGASAQRAQVERLLVSLLLNAGRPEQAEGAARRAGPSGDPEHRRWMARSLAAALDVQGRSGEAKAVRDEAGIE